MSWRATKQMFAAGLALFVPMVCRCVLASESSLDISQYAHTAWKISDGFARGYITAIAQTMDGYLWLGTEFGLLRFDGVRAVPWQPPGGEQLPSNLIRSLLVARDGTLWIATWRGLASWKDGKLTTYPEVRGAPVGLLLEDRKQTIWFGVYETSKGRLCSVRDGRVECSGAETFGSLVLPLYEDHKGNLWVSSSSGLWRWAPGHPQRFAYPRGVTEANALIEDDVGALWLATNDGLKQLVGERIENYPLPAVTGHFRPYSFLRGREGSLWIGTNQGLLHLHQGRVDGFRAIDGLSGDIAGRIFEDREGNVWVTTVGGLDRFREYVIPTISRSEGLSNSEAWSVQASPDGSVWIGTTNALNRWTNGHVIVYRGLSPLGQGRRADETGFNVGGSSTEIEKSGFRGTPHSLGMDDSGRLWASTGDGVFYFDRGRFMRIAGIPGGNIYSIAGDGHGNVWLLHEKGGLFFWSPNGAIQQIPLSQFPQKMAIAMLPDQKQGGVWLGFFEGGLVYLKDKKVIRSYGPADGLGDGRVTQLRFSSRGTLWAATEGGLSRIKNGHIETLSSKNGLPCDAVHWSMEDDDHDVWLYMPCCLARIERSEWDAWVDDPKHVITATLFDNSDGVRSVGVYGGYSPHMTKSPDGRIWFLPREGVSVIDPRHLSFNKLPPPVYIEEITADHKTYSTTPDSSGRVSLPPRVRDLQIDYTAPSLVTPEKVLFRYKLEGWDRDWQEAGTRRQAFYSNLPPRNYTFRVKACNNSGVWNESGASLNLSIDRSYYQTWWFRSLCVTVFLALLWALYRWRVQQLRSQETRLRDVVDTIPTMAFAAQPDGYRTFVNKGWVEYTGMTVEQSLGSGWHAVIHPEDLKRVLGKWEEALACGKPMYYEARYRRGEDGEYRWFMVRVVPQRDNRGKIVKWYGTASDMEDRKRAEELQSQLAHINRVSIMGELSASLSHELKQPIAAAVISANSALEWLNRDKPNLERARETTARIVKYGTRAADIIDRLRSLYQKSPLKHELLDVNEVVGEMVVLLRGESNRHGVSIRTELAADFPKVTVDRVQIQQVLMNLMLNGIEAMKDTGGVLALKSQVSEAGRVMISVSDTGVGLPPDKADQIFKAFVTTKPDGSGMGLAISQSIIESHGGRLWATPNPGRGATFHFILPTVAEPARAPGVGA